MISSVVCIINNMEQRTFIYYLHFCLSKKKMNNNNKIKGTIYKLTLKVFIRVLFLKIKNPLFRWTNEKFHFLLILRKRSKLNDFWLRVFSSRSEEIQMDDMESTVPYMYVLKSCNLRCTKTSLELNINLNQFFNYKKFLGHFTTDIVTLLSSDILYKTSL